MPPPVTHGMPHTDSRFPLGPKPADGRRGRIRLGGPCRDDYRRIETYHDAEGRVVILQAAALRSFQAAEGHVGFTIVLTGSHRSCDVQRRLFASDPKRFADPDESYHPRGLAIDVS